MRIRALVNRIVLQLARDKRTLALLFMAPLLILTLMHFLFTSNDVPSRLGVEGVSSEMIEQWKSNEIELISFPKTNDIKKTIIDNELDGYLVVNGDTMTLTVENTDPSRSKMLRAKIQQVLLGNLAGTSEIETKYVYGSENTSFFDVLSPILVGFFVFFFVFLISGIGLLRERMTGTLERLLSTPIQRWEIVFGYLIGYGLFAIIQTIIVVTYAVNVLDMVLVGSIWHVLVINGLIALVALSLGILLSSFASSEFQMIQFIPLVIVPQVFFTGIIPVDEMPEWLQGLSKVMPISYGADALKSIMYKGYGLSDVKLDVLVLLGFAIVFILLNIVALKKYRKN
ncbi:DrrB family ABC transporter efflux protein [Paenisporosarcina sp. HGH0030]|uniref:ABC transporter permease n=1 Tax=Paenisporosarcina sp. HGH0030 TaxID=1078085 RepID=UPI00034E8BE6|nr:ABC transporter permease [Paenisporosarcina sp. HGH0030]EPD51381.1 DrrB family ABC transporter efflux protein [Paenisporosarcina sp. HGH0030]